MRKLSPRMVGGAMLIVSLGTTWVHRAIYETARHGPAQLAEFGLSLATFLLASTGLLLLIHGGRLFRPGSTEGEISEPAPVPDAGNIFDTREGASLTQARHAISVSKRSRDRQASEHVVRS